MVVGSGRYKHPEGASPTLVKLIDAMLVVDPEKRPDIQTVRIHQRSFVHDRRMHTWFPSLPRFGSRKPRISCVSSFPLTVSGLHAWGSSRWLKLTAGHRPS